MRMNLKKEWNKTLTLESKWEGYQLKITSILFWGGMVTTIMLFALFFGLICQDIIYKRVHNGVKYFL